MKEEIVVTLQIQLCIGHDTRLTHDHFITNAMLVLSPINKSTRDKLNHLKILYSYGLSF